MFCGKCGVQNPDSYSFCSACGFPLQRLQHASSAGAAVSPAPAVQVAARPQVPVTVREALLEPEKHIDAELTGITYERTSLRGVGGWLLFFCIATTIIAPLLNIVDAVTSNDPVVILTEVAFTILAFCTGLSLWRVRPHALRWVRVYLIVGSCLMMVAGLQRQTYGPTSSNLYENPVAVAVVYVVTWWQYFRKSKRVKATFGSNL
jgi:hypothetical protein